MHSYYLNALLINISLLTHNENIKKNTMKKLNLLLLIFAAFMFTFTSCTKEEITETEITEIPTDIDEDQYNSLLDNIENRDDLEEGLELGCFSIVTPFSLDINGDIVEINTFEDLENAFQFDDSDVAVNVDFVYPLNITFEDGETAEIADGEALGEAFALCIPDEGWVESDTLGTPGEFPAYLICDINSCYELIYPVTLANFSGNTYTPNNEDEFIELLSTEENLVFVFPLSLEGEDGVITVESSEDLFDLLFGCHDHSWDSDGNADIDSTFNIGGIACYDLEFPATFEGLNGTEVVINNYEELSSALLDGTIWNFIYPFTLSNFETNELLLINNDEEYEAALEECWDGGNDGGQVDPPVDGSNAFLLIILSDDFEGDCYSINYPIDIVNLNSFVITYESVDDFNGDQYIDLVYPITVTLLEGGEEIILENDEDLEILISECI